MVQKEYPDTASDHSNASQLTPQPTLTTTLSSVDRFSYYTVADRDSRVLLELNYWIQAFQGPTGAQLLDPGFPGSSSSSTTGSGLFRALLELNYWIRAFQGPTGAQLLDPGFPLQACALHTADRAYGDADFRHASGKSSTNETQVAGILQAV